MTIAVAGAESAVEMESEDAWSRTWQERGDSRKGAETQRGLTGSIWVHRFRPKRSTPQEGASRSAPTVQRFGAGVPLHEGLGQMSLL